MYSIASSRALVDSPRWAVLMRELLDRMPSAVESVCDRYLAPDGSYLWPQPERAAKGIIDGLDDAYEGFHTWPLAYVLGAGDSLLIRGENGFDAVTRQFADILTPHGHPVVVSEYEEGYDWFHQGEGYMLFYHLCAANPDRLLNQERAQRFAGFLLNRDVPEPNFDFTTFHFRAPHIGSMGPAFRNFHKSRDVYRHLLQYYGLPFQTDQTKNDPQACFSNPSCLEHYAKDASGRLGRGDVATNLASTSMAINAFLLTGDTTYRDWALNYIDGWMRKADANGGLIPDNVGLSGVVGEHTGGTWFGGNYGWTWPHGWHSLGKAVILSMQNALLLTGDQKYPDFLRRHLEILAGFGIEAEGTLNVPHKHGAAGWYDYDTSIPMLSQVLREPEGPILWRDGWYEFRPLNAQYTVMLWEMTHQDRDGKLLERLRNHRSKDWESIKDVPSKDLSGHDAAWGAYLRGEFPDYPERILEHNLAQLEQRLDFMARDTEDPARYGDSYLHARNPISNEGLVQLTMGCSMPVYNGGLIQAVVRFFDADRRRPGLPQDVAALVERVGADFVDLSLVNLHPSALRRLVLRAGFYGQHRIRAVTLIEPDNGSLPEPDPSSNGSDMGCTLTPKSILRIRLEIERYSLSPHLRMPSWPDAFGLVKDNL